jgi:tetratricopeptide (TPR) repeat protein
MAAAACVIAVIAVVAMSGLAAPARAGDAGASAAASSGAGGSAVDRSPPDLRELDQWLAQKAQNQLVAMPSEARLAYRRGVMALKSHQDAQAVSLLRGAAELDPSFAGPHLTLAWWFLTREPSQALLSCASLLHRMRDDFPLQLELAANALFFAINALFFALLAAALILVGLHQHELRHIWRERLGVFLAPRSAKIWSWVFLLMPWVLGLGVALPALVMLAMLWPVLRVRERLVFAALGLLVIGAPFASTVVGRLALPLRSGGAPFYGVTTLGQRDETPDDHERVARLAAEHPKSPYLQYGLGWLDRRGGDLVGAEAAYRRTLELWPKSDAALNNLGNLLAMQGRFDEALKCYQRAVEVNPQNAAAFFNASQVHTRLFDYGSASEAVARASALDFELVKSYQSRSGESGDLPLVDQWIEPLTFWTTLLQTSSEDVPTALPATWNAMIETSGWPFAAVVAALVLAGLGSGFWWQRKMPLRACSNCGRPVCRRCAQRLREVALCPECAVIAARAESGEFGRVLLLQQRRKIEHGRSMIRTAGAALVPGLGLLARQRVFASLVLLSATAWIATGWLGVPAPFGLSQALGAEQDANGWGIAVFAVLVYAISLLAYLRIPEAGPPDVRVTSSSRASGLSDPPARAA